MMKTRTEGAIESGSQRLWCLERMEMLVNSVRARISPGRVANFNRTTRDARPFSSL